MNNATTFMTFMAMLSTASNQLTENIKIHIPWLNNQNLNPREEALRQAVVHVLAGCLGGGMAYSVGFHPLTLLGDRTPPPWASGNQVEYVLIALMVSYGGSFFNEALDILREYKLAQEQLRENLDKGNIVS